MADNSITLSDTALLPLEREAVWQKLNDPEVLAACIRGCSAVERDGDNFKAVISAKLGDYQKDFKVNLTVLSTDAPEAYELSSKLSAGFLGRASAQADIRLLPEGEAKTQLHYTAIIKASGVISRGLPIVENMAQRRVKEFFDAFVALAEQDNNVQADLQQASNQRK